MKFSHAIKASSSNNILNANSVASSNCLLASIIKNLAKWVYSTIERPSFIIGAASGALVSLSLQPLDVIRTRLQAQAVVDGSLASNGFHVARDIWQNGGIKSASSPYVHFARLCRAKSWGIPPNIWLQISKLFWQNIFCCLIWSQAWNF